MLVTNEYGRSLVNPNLYRLSANSELYTFQSYAGWYLSIQLLFYISLFLVVSNVTPNAGSKQGGTTLTIIGDYFSNSIQYPLIVKVGGEICTILSVSQTIIQCETPTEPTIIHNQYQGSLDFLLNTLNFFIL